MRKIDKIIVHCSATPECKAFSVADIDRWHRARGWKGCGYHFVILLDGSVQNGCPIERVGAHAGAALNPHSIGVCYIGGYASDGRTPKDTRTPEQKTALLALLRELKKRFPDASIHGHREFAAKACPCFDAAAEYANL